MTHAATSWKIRARTLDLREPLLMGILNTTPDSFSDGGDHIDADRAIRAGLTMLEHGAAILDIGGESTRPGASRIDANEQIRRTLPVIQGLRERASDAVLSIDTTLEEVAHAAIEAGAIIINDVSAGEESPGMFALAARTGAGLVLMHRLTTPDRDVYSHQYERPPEYRAELGQECAGGPPTVVVAVRDALLDAAARAERVGVERASIALDPGLGFGKSVDQNLELLRHTGAFVELGLPVLVGASRKSFLGAITGVESPADRDPASVAAAIEALRGGAQLIRAHTIEPHAQAMRFFCAIRGEAQPSRR